MAKAHNPAEEPVDHLTRRQRIAEWYGPARFGLFYHWGLCTGGGSGDRRPEFQVPYKHETVADFEAAAGSPGSVAKNMVDQATQTGAKYIIYTLFATTDRFALKYPTRLAGFPIHLTQDYSGALLEEGNRRGVRIIFYIPACADDLWDTPGGPWLPEGYREQEQFESLLYALVDEVVGMYGDKIGGFWLDSGHDPVLPDYIHSILPHAIVTVNNGTTHSFPGADVSTTEWYDAPVDPPYNRPSGLIKPPQRPNREHHQGEFNRVYFDGDPERNEVQAPKRDFNEDIPTCNGWFHGSPYQSEEQLRAGVYVQDPTYWVREMISSIGQRGQWNYAMGIGPTEEGKAPAMFEPMMETMSSFMEWAGESVYNTTGGECASLQQGWWNEGGFGSITVSLADPRVLYLHVTTPPSCSRLVVQNNGGPVREVLDLRTGQRQPFVNRGALNILQIDWSDTAIYGDKVFKAFLEE